jgi:DNA modification methylase
MGDSYAGSGEGGGGNRKGNEHGQHEAMKGKRGESGLKPKDLCGMPWRVAFTLQADGWWLRSDIIWAKPNPMPESVTDRPTRSHEYIFLLTKSSSYFYDADAVREPPLTDGLIQGSPGGSQKTRTDRDGASNDLDRSGRFCGIGGRNKRSVWTITTQPFPEAHFATFPIKIPLTCIKTTRKDAIIYDPFFGAGTVGVAAEKLNRSWIGSEINSDYCKIAQKRIDQERTQLKLAI